MKLLLSVFLFLNLVVIAQEKELKDITTYPNPTLIINWSYNSFTEIPAAMEVSPLSTGVDIYALKTLFGKDNFISMAMGAGISVQNIKSNSYLVSAEYSYFIVIPDDLKYRNSKLSTVFIDVPIELRLRSRPKPKDKAGIVRKRNFKYALGFKMGYNIQRYVKYEGEDYRAHNYGEKVKFKTYKIEHVLPFRYGVYTRIGVGKFSLYGYYALSDFFENKKGPRLRPFSIGISIQI